MSRKIAAIAGSAIFLVLAPGLVAGVVPWWICHWRMEQPLLGVPAFRVIGAVLIAIGSIGLLDSFGRFALQGLGTPAPAFPTRHLVVTGLYRFVRNPMYVGVVSAILGQGMLFGSVSVLEYGAIVWFLFHVFVLIYEEPTLTRSFGDEYRQYRRTVPRWIPRLSPGAVRPVNRTVRR
jgi:protein-S-isoprenylcysteine O-methyltransferase Ste14